MVPATGSFRTAGANSIGAVATLSRPGGCGFSPGAARRVVFGAAASGRPNTAQVESGSLTGDFMS